MTGNKRFRVTLRNNTVRFVDFEENKQLMLISFKKHNDAVDCQNALKFQCDLLNELNNQADAVRTELQLCEEENTELQKENEQLKSEKEDMQILINNISDQRDEFHRAVRENANCVGKLKKENEDLNQLIRKIEDNLNKYKLINCLEYEDWKKEIWGSE